MFPHLKPISMTVVLAQDIALFIGHARKIC